ncbi:MAG: hypothetical protein J6W96_00830 [Alphaproteobacteria bacterium]|nr:hypothetical protein [Alphaproteobacteria bacterium]
MFKRFFKSSWPFQVMLAIGFLTFIVGDFFGEFIPGQWLEPLAWVSSVSFIGGFILMAIAYGMDEDMLVGALITGGGALLLALWLVLHLLGLENVGVNNEFLDTNIFKYPAFGLLFGGMLVEGVTVLVKSIDQKSWNRIAVIDIGMLFVLVSLVGADLTKIITLPEKSVEIFHYATFTVIILGVLLAGKLAWDDRK